MVKNPPANAGDVGSILGGEDPLDKEIATHSRIPARKVLWTEEPGRLQFIGLQRVEYNLGTKQQQIFNRGTSQHGSGKASSEEFHLGKNCFGPFCSS